MNEYISKPFNLGALNALLSKYLQASRKENAPSPSNVVGNTVNLNFLEGLAPENKAFQHDMLELFKKQTEMYMGHIRTAFKSKDRDGIANNAHAYKPLGIYVGLDELSQIVGKLERAAVEIPPNVRLEEDLIRQIDLLIEKSMPGINHFIELHKHS